MTPDQKRDAWVRFVVAAVQAGDSTESGPVTAGGVTEFADTLLGLMEQREREGRFGAEEVPPPAGYSLNGWANPNAVKRYEETIERLGLLLEQRDDNAAGLLAKQREAQAESARTLERLSDVSRRAGRAESLLKEALRSAGRLMDALGHLVKYGRPAPGGEQIGNVDHIEQAMGAVGRSLARARQEGFSDGE